MSFWKTVGMMIVALWVFEPLELLAQRGESCDSCEACTAALGVTEARVEMSGDLVHEGDGPCIVIRGADARLDGLERDIRPVGGTATVGVRIEADGVLVRNVHVMGADVGIEVAGSKRVTLFHNWIQATNSGIAAEGAEGLRITRSVIQSGAVGVSLGAGGKTACVENTPFTARGVVIQGTHVSGAGTGILACDTLPVLSRNVVSENEVGVHIAAPAKGPGGEKPSPWDPCACAPEITEASAGTALFYSSGCHGCQIHEEWLPDLKSRGHDIRIRETGPENRLASREFDVFIDRCLPQIMDAIGIPGCVPNYGCLSNDLTLKVRSGEKSLERETEINSSADLAHYASQCAEAAARNYGKGTECIRHLLMDNTVCNNRKLDIQTAGLSDTWAGIGNACKSTEKYGDSGAPKGACTRACDAIPTAPEMPAPREREARLPPPPPIPSLAEKPPVAPVAPPVPPPVSQAETGEAAPPEAAADSPLSNRVLIGIGCLVLLVVGGFLWSRREENGSA